MDASCRKHEKMRYDMWLGFRSNRHACDACACLLPRGEVYSRFRGCALQIDPNAFTAIGGGANKLAEDVNYGQAWGMEAILTFSLVMMVFAATDNFHAATTAHLPVSPLPDKPAFIAAFITVL